MANKQLSDGGSDGTTFGQSAADLISLYGADPVAQMAYSAAMSADRLTAITVLSGGSNYGYSSSAQAGYVTATLERVVYALKLIGVWPTTTV